MDGYQRFLRLVRQNGIIFLSYAFLPKPFSGVMGVPSGAFRRQCVCGLTCTSVVEALTAASLNFLAEKIAAPLDADSIMVGSLDTAESAKEQSKFYQGV
jgi:hypothetical protein